MKIPVTLNYKKIILEADAQDKLLDVLRAQKIYSVKCGCEKGWCGNCMVLLNGTAVPSCCVTAGTLRDATIETLESFKNNPIYQDIMTGFSQAGIHLCGYCNAGKVFTAYELMAKYHRPDKDQLKNAIKNLSLCCTDYDQLANGILYAVAARHAREGKSNAKK
ncbi:MULTISPECIES: 2Fe-2S iron-sulfur cluster-binding protein [Treponema]|jgi:carbon-monoxide dehydrogenase small subunit|uniref:Carbon-monoxide dehydrogenase small subunit n=1 Tax=Treponema rectale TaxID=744512 RepID=A0A840SCG8_9SPIR|nr:MULTISPECIES: 2Fe-2S iron-sulfur cluster-binding protein [Treponema]MBB5218534.1 carbon-monoxide dehydrogenase small subunit [Treponema rectale]MBE6354097.1 2Fe-2S iron-sulfur cluster binding domain-containing protein [Treponema sp.]MBO6176386.1 2Fe-2S iron-sulfur cluster binding domain-containing protein [Treponema sp.]QOS39782.1 ferredoxin [Treponema rectale]